MNTKNNYSQQNNYEEISLQDIFMAIWRQKILIAVITLITVLVTGIISVFVLKPVYHTSLNIIINMPESYHTKYGDYVLPISSNDQYINLITSNVILKNTINEMGYDSQEITIEDLKDRITIVQTSTNEAQNSFEVKVAADDPQEAKQLAQTLYDNYIEFLDVMMAKGAVEYFIDYYSVQVSSLNVELESNRELLEKYNELLANTPMTINQREAVDGLNTSGNNIIIMENIINPNYTELELDIINVKQTINSIESDIELYKTYLDELESKKARINEYYETGEYEEIANNIIRITTSNIYLVSEPVAPSRKSSPNNLRNIVIAALLGLMVSVFIGLIKEFWFNDDKSKIKDIR